MEPLLAFGAGAVGPVFGAYGVAAHALEVVVAYSCYGFHAAGDVVRVDDTALLSGVGPDAGEAVGLEFKIDGEVVAFAWLLLREAAHAGLDADEFLDVVADFVGDDVGLGEVAGVSAEAFEVVPEGEVDVDLFVLGAIEGAGGFLGCSAAGVGAVGVEDELGVPVLLVVGGEDLGPGFLDVIEGEDEELGVAI